jgi:hypothetical protein
MQRSTEYLPKTNRIIFILQRLYQNVQTKTNPALKVNKFEFAGSEVTALITTETVWWGA